MKFDVNLQELRSALNIVRDTIGTSAMGHEGIRIYVSKKTGRVKFTTDAGSGYVTEAWCDATVKEPGKAVIIAKKFIQYVSKLDVEKVSISMTKAGAVVVKSQRGQQSFNGYDESTFVDIPKYENKQTITMNGRAYKQLINGVSFAAQEDKNRPILEGINLVSTGTSIELITTNGISIAHFKKKIKAPELNVTVAKKSLVNAVRAIKDDDRVTIQVCNEQHVILKVGDTSYHMPLLAGKFPNIASILPGSDFPLEFTFDREEVLSMLDRAATMLDSKGILHFDSGKVTLTGEGADGRFEEFIMTDMQGDAGDVRLDIKRFMEIIKHIDAEQITVGVRERKPITIRPDSKAQHTCLLTIAG